MAFNTYTDLKNRVIGLVDRNTSNFSSEDPVSLTNMYDDWIERAIRRVYRTNMIGIPPFQFTSTITLTKGSNTFAVPSNYSYMDRAIATANKISSPMHKTSPDNLLVGSSDDTVTVPTLMAYYNGKFLTQRVAQDTVIVFTYYGFLPALSTIDGVATGVCTLIGNDINGTIVTKAVCDAVSGATWVDGGAPTSWLLSEAGELVMYWAAVEAALYFKDIDSSVIEMWEAKGEDVRMEIVNQFNRQKASGSTPHSVKTRQYSAVGKRSRRR